MDERGIVELAKIKYRILDVLPFSSLLSVATFLLYLACRLKSLFLADRVVLESGDVINSALYFVAELGFLCKQ